MADIHPVDWEDEEAWEGPHLGVPVMFENKPWPCASLVLRPVNESIEILKQELEEDKQELDTLVAELDVLENRLVEQAKICPRLQRIMGPIYTDRVALGEGYSVFDRGGRLLQFKSCIDAHVLIQTRNDKAFHLRVAWSAFQTRSDALSLWLMSRRSVNQILGIYWPRLDEVCKSL